VHLAFFTMYLCIDGTLLALFLSGLRAEGHVVAIV
jgi:hypothetical protein